jgi:hypothetical protein
LESCRSTSPESSRCLARTSTPSEKKDKGKKEQREPKLLLAMDPAWGSQLKSKSPPHPHQEWQEEEEDSLQIWIRFYLPGRKLSLRNLKLQGARPLSHPAPATMAAGGEGERGRRRI